MDLHCYMLVQDVTMSDKIRKVNDLTALITESDNTGTVNRLPGSGHPRQTNMH